MPSWGGCRGTLLEDRQNTQRSYSLLAAETMGAESNPFAAAKSRRIDGGAGGKPQHTIKYYLWQLLQEREDSGFTAGELVQQLESRGMRSFAGNKKATLQVSTACRQQSYSWRRFPDAISHPHQVQAELGRTKQHFHLDRATRRWSLQRHDGGFSSHALPAFQLVLC